MIDSQGPYITALLCERVLEEKDGIKTAIPSVVTSKPANGGHRKSGQWGWPGTVLFYPFEPVPGKPVLVRQLRGPHLRT